MQIQYSFSFYAWSDPQQLFVEILGIVWMIQEWIPGERKDPQPVQLTEWSAVIVCTNPSAQ